MDETYWQLYAEKGSEMVKPKNRAGEKAPFTAFGAFSCSDEKLPL
jgi:hypothetical protein